MPTAPQVVLPVVLRGLQVVLFEPFVLTKGLVFLSGRRDSKPAITKRRRITRDRTIFCWFRFPSFATIRDTATHERNTALGN